MAIDPPSFDNESTRTTHPLFSPSLESEGEALWPGGLPNKFYAKRKEENIRASKCKCKEMKRKCSWVEYIVNLCV
jgi:hypothetical protein